MEEVMVQYTDSVYLLITDDLGPHKDRLNVFLANLGSSISSRTQYIKRKSNADIIIDQLKKLGFSKKEKVEQPRNSVVSNITPQVILKDI